ncbi:NAD(P)-dependent oxidoreductase [Burkholderia sp. Bp9017]|uniref:NAD(P)-dependent oxidoreductase n=1 Tax=unclassified Burkholderia TaxID=2613784 RepID=UPI000F5D7611|nr:MULTISPECIES: NAD(P)-dependent oxidoreductase [unclassified Burkholderia]RQZ31713.1 NAD(P)-dependent oxidoreductase [Burkholderia sp. Bp9017]RQZ37844.1 NAD(P)-dependent oxidoreductase [Burkholderia sp. Bp9016]
MKTIGYIGLGSMGSALALRLLDEYQLIVWDLNPAAASAFEALGAVVASSAAELARRCDLILLCLPRTSDVDALIFGDGGLAGGLRAGTLIIDQTSGIPAQTRALAVRLVESGVALIDAPVSGGVVGANAGTISIMVSGPGVACETALPVLRAISPNVFRCGDQVGDGQAMKLVNNLLSAGCRLSTLEVIAMGRKMGVSLAALTDAVNRGSGRNRTTRTTLSELAAGKLMPSRFAMALMLKDMNQAIQLAMDNGVPTPLTNIVRGLLQIGVSTLGETAQLEQAIELVESMAGTRIMDAEAGSPAVSGALPRAVAGAHGTPPRIGYVGLGTMGGALARRLLLSHPVRVFDLKADARLALEAVGATVAEDLPSLARDCDVIFICVPTSAAVRALIFGEGGLAEGLSPGKIVVDQTTGDPSMTVAIGAELRQLGVSLIDAPVAGGARGAVAGTIAIMCGGQDDAFDAVHPILASISPNVVHCGPLGNGHITKLVNNAISTCNCLLTYEAASIAVKAGLKLDTVATVINRSTGWSAASERILPSLSEGRATADFQLQWMVKDLQLAGRMALACGAPMLVARTVCSLYEAGAHMLGKTENIDAIARFFETTADVRFVGA